MRFLYSQLELLLWYDPRPGVITRLRRLCVTCGLVPLCSEPADCGEDSVFTPRPGGGYRLRDGVLFHMYVSSSPCGDARLNCPYESKAACEMGTLVVLMWLSSAGSS